jgi:serine/threonine protein kinase
VLLALQYVHLLGVIYRDLKPENLLMHRTGHVLLTDFDLSYDKGTTHPSVTRVIKRVDKRPHGHNGGPSMTEEYTMYAEPMARANSFVGTEEYLAPEVISGTGHGAPVDWWCLGILLYELLLGTTPFKGTRREVTFHNIIHTPLAFPTTPTISDSAKDLITKLLVKDPSRRLGSKSGADDIKPHPFFHSVKWALLRNSTPPYIPDQAKASGGQETQFEEY